MKEHDKFAGLLNLLTLISGIFVILCYGAYFLVSLFQGSLVKTLIIPTIAIAAAAVAIAFRKRFPTVLRVILCAGMCFYMITFTVFCTVIMSWDESTEADNGREQVVIVFGCRTYGYNPSRALKARLDRALEVLEKYPDAVIITSGGQGENETLAEAEAMRGYLVEHGVPNERIYTEEDSSNTIENISGSLRVIEENGLSERQLIGVSSEFHLPRISLLCARRGIDIRLYGAPEARLTTLWANLVREYMAYVKLLIFG